MPKLPKITPRSAWLIAATLILARSFVFVVFEGAYFDSDQAIIGLMAKHLSEFKAFPLYFYGQSYLLTISAWLAAPFVGILGASVFALKIPLLLLNLLFEWLLLRILIVNCGLTAGRALTTTLFFCLAPVITASRLVEMAGGNIEPFIFILLLWILRDRPWLSGIAMGLGYLNRPFVLYGILAVVFLRLKKTPSYFFQHPKNLIRGLIQFSCGFAAVYLMILFLKPFSSNSFGAAVQSSLHFSWEDVHWLFTDNIATLMAYRDDLLSNYAIHSSLTSGHSILNSSIYLSLIAIAISITFKTTSKKFLKNASISHSTEFPAYLICVSLFSALGYILMAPLVRNNMLIRYNLLFTLLPIGLSTWIYQNRIKGLTGRSQSILTVVIILWSSIQSYDHFRLVQEYLIAPPSNPHRNLAQYLEDHQINCGLAPYWTSYHIDFLSSERLKIQSYEYVRIPEYSSFEHTCALITPVGTPPRCPAPAKVDDWQICVGKLTS